MLARQSRLPSKARDARYIQKVVMKYNCNTQRKGGSAARGRGPKILKISVKEKISSRYEAAECEFMLEEKTA